MTASFNKLKPIVFIWDQDGVQVDWTGGLNKILLQLDPDFPIIENEDREHYDHLMGPGGDPEVLRAALHHPELYSSLELIPGTIQAMKEMEEDDRVDPWICTMPEVRNPTCASLKLASIEASLGAGWTRRTALMSDKTLMRGDWLIDDKPKITGTMNPTWKHILFDRPYNRIPVTGGTSVTRMTEPLSWREFLPAEYRAAA